MTVAERSAGDVTIIDVDGRITVEDGADVLRASVRGLIRQGRVKLLLNLVACHFD